MRRPLGIIGLALLVLQGCAEVPWVKPKDSEQASRAAEEPAETVHSVQVPSVQVPESPPTPPRKPVETAALPSAPTEPDEPQATLDVDTLLGLDFSGVSELLGAASLEEIQAPATVWTYSGRGCVLSIFFYPHVDGGDYRALTYDVRSQDKAPTMSQECFDELLQEREKTEVN